MTLDDTNIISDDDFLNEILNNVKTEVAEVKQQSDLDKLLGLSPEENDENSTPTPTPTDPPKEQTTEEGEQSSEEEIAQEEKTTYKKFGVRDTVTTLIENNTWKDMPIKYGDSEYDSITELLEKEKPSKELFESLSEAQRKLRDEEIDETYIKIGDKNTTQAKLANAILQGIPYNDLLENYQEVIEPLQQIDFANIQNGDYIAEEFVKQCLVELDGYHPASIGAVIKNLKDNFQLIDVAEQYQERTIQNFNAELEQRELGRREEAQRLAEQTKQDMKSLRLELKNQNISDAFASKILKLRYNVDPQSGNYHYEQLLNDKLKDKSFEARLLHFLLDEKDFIQKERSTVKTDTHKKVLELMKMTPSSKGAATSSNKHSGNLETDDEDFLRDIGLIKD